MHRVRRCMREWRRSNGSVRRQAGGWGAEGQYNCLPITSGLVNSSVSRQSVRLLNHGDRPGSMIEKLRFVPAGIVSLLTILAHAETVPLFPSQAHVSSQGFVRVINHSNGGGAVSIRAMDDSGMTYGPVTLSIGAGRTVHFNS